MDSKECIVEICRVCLKKSEFTTDIFKTKIGTVVIAEIVSACSSSYIWEGDGMPNSVCSKCLRKLESYWELRVRIKSSENILRSSMEFQRNKKARDSKCCFKNLTSNRTDQKVTGADITKVEQRIISPDVLINEMSNYPKTEDVKSAILKNEAGDFAICENKMDIDTEGKEEISGHNFLNQVLDFDISTLKDDITAIKNNCDIPNANTKYKRQKLENDLTFPDNDNEYESDQSFSLCHKNPKVKCKSCRKSISPEKLKLHNDTVHRGSKMFKCQICNSYISLKYYDMHMAVHR